MTAIPVRRGSTLRLSLEFFADEAETTPLDLTGTTLVVNDPDSTFPVNPTVSITDYPGGIVTVFLSATNTRTLTASRNYSMVLDQTLANGDTVKHGPFKFVASAE